MRTAAICPTCATYYNAVCVLYDGPGLSNIPAAPLDNLDTILVALNGTIGGINTSITNLNSNKVPYTGANANVNLGAFTITAGLIVKTGGLSTQFLKADGSVDSNTYLTTASASSTYVPYTGATSSVNLGGNNLTANNITANSSLYTNQWRQIGNSLVSTYDSAGNNIGIALNYTQQKVRIGDFNSNFTGTELIVDYNNQWVEIVNGALRVNGSVGSAGNVLLSQGAGLPPQWSSGYTGSFNVTDGVTLRTLTFANGILTSVV